MRPQINDRVALIESEIKNGKGKIGVVAAVYGGHVSGSCIVGIDWEPENNSGEFKILQFVYPQKLKRIR